MSINIANMSKQEFEIYDDELNRILKYFHTAAFRIIAIAEAIDPKNHYIEWVKQQIHLFRKIDKENIIRRMKDKLWDYRNEIMAHNMEFFKTNQFSKYIKNDERKQFMHSFIGMLQKKFDDLKPEESAEIWDNVEKLLIACIEYKKLIKDYDE
jgi:hypothetical protein